MSSTSGRWPSSGRALWVAVPCLALLLLGLVLWRFWPTTPAPGPVDDDKARAVDDPRLTFATPYRNVRPEVRYVGDSACAQCHPGQEATYRHHPMGRAFAPITEPAAAGKLFEKFGQQFSVERRDGKVFHREQRLDAQGRVLAESEAEVRYVLGSGTRGHSYLIDRDGYLFQSPISWYAQSKSWDLSPGFTEQIHFGRRIEAACLFCHCNQADAVADALNRYREPIFQGYAIGCERCHGPGQLHVEARRRGDAVAGGREETIVNPARLEPPLREAVCQQCHLQGEQRVLRLGREPFDYRPGLPLELFWSVFVRTPALRDYERSVGQVEQMYASACFRASGGKMGCTSCHDPHAVPAEGERFNHFRQRCLNCHQEQSCGVPPAERRKQSPTDNCISCHMPQVKTSNIAHTAITNHRIVRRPASPGPAGAPRLAPGGSPLVDFFQSEAGSRHAAGPRDLAMALLRLAPDPGPLRDYLGNLALPRLEQALVEAPGDAAAWEEKGWALAIRGRSEEALGCFETALRKAPRRESTLELAAQLAERLKRSDEALAYTRRLVAVDPWPWKYRYRLAQLLGQRGQWTEALREAEAALRLNPFSREARCWLITCCLHCGQPARAEKEFATLLALNPGSERELRAWLAGQGK